MSKFMFTSSRHAIKACDNTVMGDGSVSARTGVPKEMWDTSSVLRHSFRMNGYNSIQKMLNNLDEYEALIRSIDNIRLGEQARTDRFIESIHREAAGA